MKKKFSKIFIVATIIVGGLNFSSCQHDSVSNSATDTDYVTHQKKIMSPSNIDDLLYTEFGENIPTIEDLFSEFTGQIHNGAVEYIMERMNNINFNIFTNTGAQRDSILLELGNEYLEYLSSYYNIDIDDFTFLPDYIAEAETFLSNDISSELLSYIQQVKSICCSNNITELPIIYSIADNLQDDRERLLLKCYAAGAIASFQYWHTSNYSEFSFLPSDIMYDCVDPAYPILFVHTPQGINWGRVGNADGYAILQGLTITIMVNYAFYGPQLGICWATAGTIIGINAAVTSIRATLDISLYNTIDAMNPYHPYFYEDNNSIYEYMHEMYNIYGYEYFETHWDGRFLFMIDNF